MQQTDAQPTAALIALAAARDAYAEASTRSEEAQAQHGQILVRRADAQARGAEALRLARANGDADGKQAMAMKIADADAAELAQLAAQGSAHLQALSLTVQAAKERCVEAERAAHHEEAAGTLRALQEHAAKIEAELVSTLAAMAVANRALNPRSLNPLSLFKVWEPTKALSEAVNRFIAPVVA